MVQPDLLMADARAFMKSRVILTGAQLDFFTKLHDTPNTADEMAGAMKLDPRATTRVLDTLVTLGLIEKENGLYRTTEEGTLFSSRHPQTVLPMVLHLSHLWETWSRLTDIVKGGPNPEQEPGVGMSEESRKSFIGAMHAIGHGLSMEIAGDYDLSPFKRLLDIGGGSGTYTIAFLKTNPRMTGVIFDLQSVISMARERIEAEGLEGRVEFVPGDFYGDELPKGCDLALLSAIIHQNSPEENLELYSKIRQALVPGGKVLIRDHVMDESRTAPPAGAMFALNMLVNTRGGDTYTFDEVKETLEKAGFVDVKLVRKGERMDCLVEATSV